MEEELIKHQLTKGGMGLQTPKLSIPELPGVSLVAFYGKKPRELEQLILRLQRQLRSHFATDFIPYELAQVHATIIGCEGLLTTAGIINKWFYQLRNETRYFDGAGFIDYWQMTKSLPVSIRFGGYQKDQDYQFLSREQHPRDRSFQLQPSISNQEPVWLPVVMGWSWHQAQITNSLNSIRCQAQKFNCLHKYHRTTQDIDNDFYLRLGTIKQKLTPELKTLKQQQISYYLQQQPAIIVSLKRTDLQLVKYQELDLNPATTQVYSFTKLKNNSQLILDLYR